MSNYVLNASALLAAINREPGAEVVEQAIEAGAAIGTVNLAEVATKLREAGGSEAEIRRRLGRFALHVVDFDAELAYQTGFLRPATAAAGLSLADRACLALAARLNLPVLTADHAWSSLRIGVTVQLIR